MSATHHMRFNRIHTHDNIRNGQTKYHHQGKDYLHGRENHARRVTASCWPWQTYRSVCKYNPHDQSRKGQCSIRQQEWMAATQSYQAEYHLQGETLYSAASIFYKWFTYMKLNSLPCLLSNYKCFVNQNCGWHYNIPRFEYICFVHQKMAMR